MDLEDVSKQMTVPDGATKEGARPAVRTVAGLKPWMLEESAKF